MQLVRGLTRMNADVGQQRSQTSVFIVKIRVQLFLSDLLLANPIEQTKIVIAGNARCLQIIVND